MCELEHVRLKLSKTPLLLCCRMELPAFPAPHWSMSGVLGRAASLPAFVRRLASAAINVNVWRRAQSTSSPSATAIDLYAGRRALLVVGGTFADRWHATVATRFDCSRCLALSHKRWRCFQCVAPNPVSCKGWSEYNMS